MIIKILLTIVSLFIILFLESFFTTLFSFSLLMLGLLILIDKSNWKIWSISALIPTLLIDVLLHRPIGVTLLVVSLCVLVLYLLFLVIPKKEEIFSYVPYFFAVFLFYLLLTILTPLFQDGVWGVVNWKDILGYVVKSLITVGLLFLSNRLIENFRSGKDILI